MMNNNCKIVTCLYDIGRSEIDGRTTNDYSRWILETFENFPEITVYYNSEEIRSMLDSGQNWIYKDVEEFALINKYEEVLRICNNLQKRSDDLTFKLPLYSILQFEKFQFLAEQKKMEPNLKGALWVDAGISRFINSRQTSASKEKSKTNIQKILNSKKSLFEVDPKRNLTIFKNLKYVKTGTCTRSFSGTSFYLDQEDIFLYAQKTLQIANLWIENFQWDNEQIALNQLFLNGSISPRILLQKDLTGSVARYILGMENAKIISPQKIRKFGSTYRKSRRLDDQSIEGFNRC